LIKKHKEKKYRKTRTRNTGERGKEIPINEDKNTGKRGKEILVKEEKKYR